MRIFIAIELSNDLKDYISRVQASIGSEFAKVRFVGKEHMHLTLKFLGEIQPKKTDKIIAELKKIEFKSFVSYLDSIGIFPSQDYIRVLWLGLNPEKNIIDLQKAIDEKLEKVFKKEKEFRPHVTLGRVKFVNNLDKLLERLKNIKTEKIKIEVGSFRLIKSTLKEQGPEYEILEIFDSNDGGSAK